MGKSGIPYFPLDVELDEKMELIEAEYGLTGYAVILKLLQRIYGRARVLHTLDIRGCAFVRQEDWSGWERRSGNIEAAVKRGVFHKKNL